MMMILRAILLATSATTVAAGRIAGLYTGEECVFTAMAANSLDHFRITITVPLRRVFMSFSTIVTQGCHSKLTRGASQQTAKGVGGAFS